MTGKIPMNDGPISGYSPITLSDKHQFLILSIPDDDQPLLSDLEAMLVSICEGDNDVPVSEIKTYLLEYLKPKTKSQKKGVIAELLLHFVLRKIGLRQECQFLNLEERSVKKGFDGYYSRDGEGWIVESKSGELPKDTTIDQFHIDHLKIAHRDLTKKISNPQENNPWRNAYNHAVSVNAAANIREELQKLSNEFRRKVVHVIDEFNVIPSSTGFTNETCDTSAEGCEINNLKDTIVSLAGKKVLAVGISKSSFQSILNYLESKP